MFLRFLTALAIALAPIGGAQGQAIYKLALQSGPPNGGCYPSAPLPADTGPAFAVALGTCALTKKWLNGKFADVTAQSRTITIRFVKGYPDVKTLAALMGILPSCPAGTAGAQCVGGLPMSTWYDQSGNGNNCTQSTGANQMAVWLIDGKVFIAADGMFYDFEVGSNGDKFCNLPSGLSTNNQSLSVYAALRPAFSGAAYGFGSSYFSTIFNTGASESSGFFLGTSTPSGSYPQWSAFNWVNFASSPILLFAETGPLVLGVSSGAGTSQLCISQNEEVACGTTIPSGTASGGQVGGLPTSYSLNSGYYGRYQALLISNSLFTGSQPTAERNSLYALFGICKSPNYSVLVDGASLDDGTGSFIGGIAGYGWMQQMQDVSPACIRWGNTAVPGATAENITTNFSTAQAAFYSSSYAKNILFGPNSAAGNSITEGDTASQTYTAVTNYVNDAVAAGWSKANIFTYSAIWGATGGSVQQQYNTLLFANTLGIQPIMADGSVNDTVCPMNAGLLAGPPGAPYFNGSSGYGANHPTVIGHNVMAKCFWPQVIQQAIGP